MNFIKPKYVNVESVEFSLSERTRKLIELCKLYWSNGQPSAGRVSNQYLR
jgi:hypothetical protein